MAQFTKKQFETAANVAIKDAGGKKNLVLNVFALTYRGRTIADAAFHYVTDGNIHPYYADQKAYLERHKIAHNEKNYKTVYNNLFSRAVNHVVVDYIRDHHYEIETGGAGDSLYLVDKYGKRVR